MKKVAVAFPLIIVDKRVAYPIMGKFRFESNTEVKFYCLGLKNNEPIKFFNPSLYVLSNPSPTSTLLSTKCSNGAFLMTDNRAVPNMEYLRCTDVPQGTERDTQIPCMKDPPVAPSPRSQSPLRAPPQPLKPSKRTQSPPRTASHSVSSSSRSQLPVRPPRIWQIGFQIDPKLWIPIIDVCHDQTSANTLWVRHIVRGASLPDAQRVAKKRPFFREVAGLFTGIDLKLCYGTKKRSQKMRLEALLGYRSAESLSWTLGRSDDFNRGHLAANCDFPLEALRHLTFSYINTAPQWTSHNSLVWGPVEKEVRKKAEQLAKDSATSWQDRIETYGVQEELVTKGDLIVFTGTRGVLSTLDAKQERKDIYLAPGEALIPVPMAFWKVVHDPTSNNTIVFDSLNLPLGNSQNHGVNYTRICKHLCRTRGWHHVEGDVYCCTLSDFRNAYPHLAPTLPPPLDPRRTGILVGRLYDASDPGMECEAEGDQED